ncbi:hypothetical protein GGX14DRAFT_408603 [Mycena pura]|uniref:Uncharacterized protein n=1 Tax=Mycena pura TaxID=153505 RepID=A0AAD6UNZ3_9AGAR|nr:hypothetical protein GGX14DRAFT_408603 [Mycena pura]
MLFLDHCADHCALLGVACCIPTEVYARAWHLSSCWSPRAGASLRAQSGGCTRRLTTRSVRRGAASACGEGDGGVRLPCARGSGNGDWERAPELHEIGTWKVIEGPVPLEDIFGGEKLRCLCTAEGDARARSSAVRPRAASAPAAASPRRSRTRVHASRASASGSKSCGTGIAGL